MGFFVVQKKLNMLLSFSGKILIVGYGAVARCLLTLLLKHLDIPRNHIIILDPLLPSNDTLKLMQTGIRYFRCRILQSNYEKYLAQLVGPGDILLQLGFLIDSYDLTTWCRNHNVLYLNSGNDSWLDPNIVLNADLSKKIAANTERILKEQHVVSAKQGSTAVLLHGANCGLVSHFAKVALEDMANDVLAHKKLSVTASKEIGDRLQEKNHAALAQALDINTLHISEHDTQWAPSLIHREGFFNTWCSQSAASELMFMPQFAWGTHEHHTPQGAKLFSTQYFNCATLSQKAYQTRIQSWVPSGPFTPNIVFHEETFTIADYLSVYDVKQKRSYAPTVLFAYQVCPHAVQGMQLIEAQGSMTFPSVHKVLTHEITEGTDELGILLFSEKYGAWWTGSVLDIHTARKESPQNNATTLQVAASLLAALTWMINNPEAGIQLPETIPHEKILPIAKPYLGKYVSQSVAFSLPARQNTASWQFNDFLIV